MEAQIVSIRAHGRKLDLLAIVLTVVSTSSLMAALGEFVESPKIAILVAGFLNLAIAVVVALKRYVEDNGKLYRYESLHDQFGEFFMVLGDAESRSQPRQVAKALRRLEESVIRVAPEIRAPEPWDKMSPEQRDQYLQTRIAQ